MTNILKRRWKHWLGLLLGVSMPSVGLSQLPPVQAPSVSELPNLQHQSAPIQPLAQPGLRTQPAATIGTANSQPNLYTPQLGGLGATAAPGEYQTAPTPVPGTPQTPPLMSSQPPPFQVTPDTPAATNDPNFYPGNKPVQDLSSLLAGKFNNTKYKWYGFVRLDSTFDFRPIGGTDSFVTSQIPIPQGRGQNFAMNPRYSRFGFDTETKIESMDWNLKTRIEMDFFNGNNSGAFGSYPLRLRFAWADFGPFLIGQAASLFMDYDVFPNVLDYQGPSGMVLMRQPVASFHFPVGERLTVSMGVEQPYSDIQWLENGAWIVNPGSGIITTPGIGRNVQDIPDVTMNVRYKGDYGHIQVAGIARKLTFQPATGDSFDEIGYGVNVTGIIHPWACMNGVPISGDCATCMSKSRILGQVAAGRGINRYIQDINGLGLDATFDPVNGFRTIPSYGWFLSYEQWWAQKWASVVSFSQTQNELTDTLPGTTYDRAEYISGNLIWLPVERMGVGIEYLYGYRRNKDGDKADNTRIQMGFQYKF